MKSLLSILFCLVFFTSCWDKPIRYHYIIKVQYCNVVDFKRDSIFEMTSYWYPVIETYKQALPVINRPNDSKIINVCAFEVIRTDTIQ